MNESNEEITVKKIHDNDKYVIKRVTTEEVNGDAIVGICDQIEKGLDEVKKVLEEEPNQHKQRMEAAQKQYSMLQERLKVFWEHGSKLREAKPEGEKKE